jgi:dihydrofolate reductase
MRELVYYVAVSVDGRIAGRDGDFSMFSTEGDHMAWMFEHYVDGLPAIAHEALGLTPDGSRFGAVVMGWNTYAAGFPQGVRDPYPHLDQVVLTRDHADEQVPDGLRVVTGDPVGEVRRLKEQSGADIWLCGGGALAAQLAGEVDRMVLKISPVVIGDGIPLFAGPAPMDLRLIESTCFESGVVVNEYARPAS